MGYVCKEVRVDVDERDEKDKLYESVKSNLEIINIGKSVYDSRFN